MRAPAISVIMPTRNRPHLLRHALASVAAQRDVPLEAVEAVVINDGGVDVTTELRSAVENGLRVRPVVLPSRQGLPAARNAGLETASGEHVAFLDDDDVFLPHHLATALSVLDGGTAHGVYTTCMISPVRIDPAARLRDAGMAKGYPFDPDLFSVANYIPVHTMALRRPSRARFDATLPALEDWDFWLRLLRADGYRFAHIPEVTAVYHRVPDQASMCGSTVTDAAALAGFGDLVQRLWRRWPATTTKATRFRAYLGVMYWHAFSLLASGQRADDLYFQRSLDVMVAAWTGVEAEDGLIDRIRDAVEGDPRAADAA